MRTSTLTAALGASVLALILTACGGDTTDTASDTSADQSTTETPDSSGVDLAAAVSLTDPWVKSAKSGKTAAFGTLVNTGETEVVVASATSEIASTMELHETVKNDDGTMAMQPKEGGFTIPAGGEHELEPGGDHLMIMDLKRPLKPGEVVTVTLVMEDGSEMAVEATVKTFTGAEEEYQNGEMDMGDSDMDDSDSGTDMESDEGSSDGS